MKTMLETLKEQKAMTIVAIERMKEAEKEYYAHFDTPYPTDGTVEDRIAYVEETGRLSAAKDSALKTAVRRLVSFGEFLGCPVNKKDLEYDWRIESRFGDLRYYAERAEKMFESIAEDYQRHQH